MGIEISQPQFIPLQSDKTDNYVRVLRENIKPQLQLVVTICPTSRDDRYNAIKRITCADQPIASQVRSKKNTQLIYKFKILEASVCLFGFIAGHKHKDYNETW